LQNASHNEICEKLVRLATLTMELTNSTMNIEYLECKEGNYVTIYIFT